MAFNDRHRASLCNGISSLFRDRTFCDVSLTTNNGDSHNGIETVECHKLVLSAASTFFSRQLKSDGAEPDRNIIDVSPVKFDVLNEVLKYIYTGACNITEHNVAQLIELGVEWKLSYLSEECEAVMLAKLSSDNAADFLQIVKSLKLQDIMARIIEFIRSNFDAVAATPATMSLDLATMEDLLSSGHIHLSSENVIFQTVCQWVEANPQCTDPNRLYKLIRFEHLTNEYLCDVVLDHPQMQQPPQSKYVRDALKVLLSVPKPTLSSRPRLYGDTVLHDAKYLALFNKSSQFCMFDEAAKTWEKCNFSSVFTHNMGNTTSVVYNQSVYLAGSCNRSESKKVASMSIVNKECSALPDLPHGVYSCGLIGANNHLYVIGGYDPTSVKTLSTVVCLDLTRPDKGWTTVAPLPQANQAPIVLKHDNSLHVIGGQFTGKAHQCYNLNTNTWLIKSAIPQECEMYNRGGLIVDSKIHIFTTSCCMIYNHELDDWSTINYNSYFNGVKPVLHGGKILACVLVDSINQLMSYDKEKNVWEKENVDISACMHTSHFHVI